jgi:hypothetical protein
MYKEELLQHAGARDGACSPIMLNHVRFCILCCNFATFEVSAVDWGPKNPLKSISESGGAGKRAGLRTLKNQFCKWASGLDFYLTAGFLLNCLIF